MTEYAFGTRRVLNVFGLGVVAVRSAFVQALANRRSVTRGWICWHVALFERSGRPDSDVALRPTAGINGGMILPARRAVERHGIWVCTIAPGIVSTPMLATVSEEFRAGLAAGAPICSVSPSRPNHGRLVTAVVELDYLHIEKIRMDGTSKWRLAD